MTAAADGNTKEKKRGRCPVCDKPAHEPYSPCCSRRCADIDLGRWLKGVYAIPAQAQTKAGDEEEGGEGDDGGDRRTDLPER
jgi:uncharacterized protein